MSFLVREFDLPSISLADLVDELSEKAQKRGLTPYSTEVYK